MSVSLSKKHRDLIVQRAKGCCEYCLMPQRFSLFSFHVDHIISLKHGGETNLENLALACGFCNANKGTDLGTMLEGQAAIIRFFNPRTDAWVEHFQILEGEILAISLIGAATVKIFRFNEIERVIERKLLIAGGFLPKHTKG
jgi:hypothetical protein